LVMRVGSSAQWSYLVVQAESNELRYVGWVASARSCGPGCTVWVT
jgi:hypothetical protein